MTEDSTRPAAPSLKGFLFTLAGLPVVAVATMVDGNPLAPVAAISFGFTLIGILVTRLRPSLYKDMLAFAAIGQPIALTAALAGHMFQLDTHMVFFAVAATLVSLNAVRPLIFATLLVAMHHVVLTLLLPSLVYPGGAMIENIMRSLFHGAVLMMETGTLIAVVLRRQKMDKALAEERDIAEAARASAEDSSAKAQSLAREAEEQREEAERLTAEARDAYRSAEEDKEKVKALSEQMHQDNAKAQEEQTRLREELQAVLDALQVGLSNLASGNLAVSMPDDLPSEYREIATDFTSAVDQLRQTISTMVENTQTVRGEANSIATATGNLVTKTREQTEFIERSVAAVEALSNELNQTSKTAEDAANVTRQAQKNTDQSRDIVEKAAQAIERIESTSGDISKITSVIDNISFQTNLLALNAGVEAARAGEAGQGFAVVAAEVRNLAMRSSEAAQEIRDLISKSEKEVNDGVEHVRQTVSALTDVGDAVVSAAELVERITKSSEDQASSVSRISEMMERLEALSQQNARLFNETNDACKALNQSAETAEALTSRFILDASDAPRARMAG